MVSSDAAIWPNPVAGFQDFRVQGRHIFPRNRKVKIGEEIMQRPFIRLHMSTGAWVFATGVAVAVIASAGVYAAANSTVAIGNPAGSTTALVTPNRQLQTTMIAPNNVVHVSAHIGTSCGVVYTPAPGKAIVVTQITYDLGTGTQGQEYYAAVGNADCAGSYDIADTIQAYETQTRTYPSGLPLPSIGVFGNSSTGSGNSIFVTGYLIPATQLPPEVPQFRGRIKRNAGTE